MKFSLPTRPKADHVAVGSVRGFFSALTLAATQAFNAKHVSLITVKSAGKFRDKAGYQLAAYDKERELSQKPIIHELDQEVEAARQNYMRYQDDVGTPAQITTSEAGAEKTKKTPVTK